MRKVKAGRPSLTGTSEHSPRVSARVPADLHALLHDRADREGKRPSEVIRDALDEYLRAS
ncbi:ribbon-helix-helix protein, CopG family [Jiangella gansuensis]|uniref:ribbon-helix-helix protein, CopG family n=1 Tax=Jiangella gansuensis TaxID=281473 RepID=UPI003CCBE050